MAEKRAGGRIQGGAFGGIPLLGLPGNAVRPTTGRVKEALFSMLAGRITGATVIDCFAGTGSLGIEALSRGARHVTFVERWAGSISVLEANLAKIDPSGSARILQRDALKPWTWGGDLLPADLILADPPYDSDSASLFLSGLPPSVLAPGGWIVLEHASSREVQGGNWNRLRTRRYGQSAISIFAPHTG